MFSSITQPKFPNAALGIGKTGISAVALHGNGRRQYSIRQAATVDLSPGVVEPSFLDSNILAPHEFASCLREVVEIAGLLNQKRWSVALPSNSARTAILALESEPASKKESEEILDWKAEQSFGAPAGDLRITRQKIAPDREGK